MGYQNFFATRLYTDIGAADATITLEAAPTVTSGRIALEARNPTKRELVSYSGVSGNQLTGVVRGIGGTTATTHTKGSLVEMNLTAEDLIDALAVPQDIVTRFDESITDYVPSGIVWSITTGLTGAMTLGIVYVDGYRRSIAAVASKIFTASKDTYVDIGVDMVVDYNEVANGAAAPVLQASHVRVARVITNGSAITSISLRGRDNLGNLIRNRLPVIEEFANFHASDYIFDYVISGLVWSGDAYASTLLASMTSGFVFMSGVRNTVASVANRAFTASKDTYVDIDTAGLITYNEVANNAAAPVLATGSVRIAIVVTGATNIASVASINQGQENKVLPIRTSIPMMVTDELGNLICPRDPNRRVLGYRQIFTDFTTASAAAVDVTGLNLFCNIPTGRRIKVTVGHSAHFTATAAGTVGLQVIDVTASAAVFLTNSNLGVSLAHEYTAGQIYTPPAAGARQFKLQAYTSAGTYHTGSTTGQPSFVLVELI